MYVVHTVLVQHNAVHYRPGHGLWAAWLRTVDDVRIRHDAKAYKLGDYCLCPRDILTTHITKTINTVLLLRSILLLLLRI